MHCRLHLQLGPVSLAAINRTTVCLHSLTANKLSGHLEELYLVTASGYFVCSVNELSTMMGCDEGSQSITNLLVINASDMIDSDFNATVYYDYPIFNISDSSMSDTQRSIYNTFRLYITKVLMPIIFSLGVIGNIANLLILSRKSFRRGLNHIERSALTGLMTLSVSDLLFCVIALPIAFLPSALLSNKHVTLRLISFYYELYGTPLLNIFLFSSTWLIIWISMERYMAVCHPFQARLAIRPRRSTAAHAVVFMLGVIINIPLFMTYVVRKSSCNESCTTCFYYKEPNMALSPVLMSAHKITWAVLGTFLPLFVLSFCNINILNAVCRTDALGTSEGNSKTLSRVTSTLVVMVFMYLLLVTPSMILTFLTGYAIKRPEKVYWNIQLSIVITNLCQAIKFASNFLLYCVTNKQFRDNVSGTICKTTSSRAVTPESSTARRYQLVGTGTQLHSPQTAIQTIMQSKYTPTLSSAPSKYMTTQTSLPSK